MTALLDRPPVADPCTCAADAVERATPSRSSPPSSGPLPSLASFLTTTPAPRKAKMPPAPSAGSAPLVAALQLASQVLAGGGEFSMSTRIGEVEVIIRPFAVPTAADATPVVTVEGVSREELFAVLFSADEKSIIRALIGHEPSKANDVLDRSRGQVEKSRFWVLWANLQHRGIVGDADQGDGFVILPAWVRELASTFDPQKTRR